MRALAYGLGLTHRQSDVSLAAPGTPGEMFGARMFGVRYFGNRYFR